MRSPALLSDLLPGQSAMISALTADGGLGQRLEALGFQVGQSVEVLRRAWWGGPLHVRIGMTELMVRRLDAHRVAVVP